MHSMKFFIDLSLNTFKSNLEHRRSRWNYTRRPVKEWFSSLTSTIRALPLLWHASRPRSVWTEMYRVEYDTFDEGVVDYEWVPTKLRRDNPHYGLDYYRCFLVIDKNGKERGMFPCPWALNIGLPNLNTYEVDRQHKLSIERAREDQEKRKQNHQNRGYGGDW